LLVNPDDDNAFRRVVNTPRREIGPTTLEKLSSYASGRGVSLLSACFELGLTEHLPTRALERLQRFGRWVDDCSERARCGDPVATARELVKEIRYEAWLRENGNDPKGVERRMANVDELINWLDHASHDGDGEGETTLADRVARMALADILERKEDDQEQDAVYLMTLHAAKGLEFPHVFMVGMEEDILPHRNSIDDGMIEEERRLAYVGITRAQRSLTLTLAQRRRRFGEWQACEPSRFLAELPEADLALEGQDQPLSPESRKERGRIHLAHLKGLLDER
jgi:ATP-dependent DNA helicase Rep